MLFLNNVGLRIYPLSLLFAVIAVLCMHATLFFLAEMLSLALPDQSNTPYHYTVKTPVSYINDDYLHYAKTLYFDNTQV